MNTTLIIMTLIMAVTFFMSVALVAYTMLKMNSRFKNRKRTKYDKVIHDWDKL